jgi:hypothetical protein
MTTIAAATVTRSRAAGCSQSLVEDILIPSGKLFIHSPPGLNSNLTQNDNSRIETWIKF